MTHETLTAFGYPENVIAEYRHWVVCLRPKQVTLGSLALISKSPEARQFSSLSVEAFAELPMVIKAIETTLHAIFAYDKINYLMLMMIDPHVHFHVLPRYREDRHFANMKFSDPGWPALPDLSRSHSIAPADFEALRDELRRQWTEPGP